jgi:site-specific recombinase XerD
MKACKINKNVSFHISRHTFATNYLLSGGNVVNLQKLMGHSKIEETMIYVHIVESLQEKEIMSMDEILEINTF